MRIPPAGYNEKFADFIKLCRETKESGVNVVLVADPSALGDTKEELSESLYRLSEQKLRLEITR